MIYHILSRCVLINSDIIKAEASHIKQQIASDSKLLENLPLGGIYYVHNGPYIKWFRSLQGVKKYIPKDNTKLISQLILRKFLMSRIEDNNKLLEYLDNYPVSSNLSSKLLYDSNISPLLFSIPDAQAILRPESLTFSNFHAPLYQPIINSWLSDNWQSNVPHPESLLFPCISGNTVRSKSESTIDLMLNQYGIPYKYECALKLGKSLFYPDFTLFNPIAEKETYWEHFGMMDNPEYMESASKKISKYIANDIIPGVNLITTFETSTMPLTSAMVKLKIEEYLLMCNAQLHSSKLTR